MSPHAWRRTVLRAVGRRGGARSTDQVDAALAALTGLFALERRFSAPGDPREGKIVLPSATLPARPYRRATAPTRAREQPSLPGSRRVPAAIPAAALTGRVRAGS